MNINTKLKKIRDLLVGLFEHTFHYEASGELNRYIVWAEDMEGTPFYAYNGKKETVMQGTIDLYTKTEFDPLVDQIHEALAEDKISARIASVQYEDETQLIHYTWDFEV